MTTEQQLIEALNQVIKTQAELISNLKSEVSRLKTAPTYYPPITTPPTYYPPITTPNQNGQWTNIPQVNQPYISCPSVWPLGTTIIGNGASGSLNTNDSTVTLTTKTDNLFQGWREEANDAGLG